MCHPNNEITTFSIKKIIRHEHFDINTYYADIMLLHLSMKIRFNYSVRPICLPNLGISGVSEIYSNRKGVVAGWGSTNAFSLLYSCIPNKLALPIFAQKDCNATASTLFCAGFVGGGRDTCKGDSGSPFQIRNLYKRYELIGIVSSGIGCALPGNPGQYTDVSLFVPWIIKHLSKYSYCW
ncbi:proclotting enzyme-like [Onthophagus taurus]|uniref:proclotting enzyme-like n=1 Tax=Onthophagus taurus TaxID=166361 RepID=UPI000C1FEFD4|nr:proclotting enzyme-like [Onthophagus taurus]XP_022904678.1 proclotting enzyme-like [Onthophagus taurus]